MFEDQEENSEDIFKTYVDKEGILRKKRESNIENIKLHGSKKFTHGGNLKSNLTNHVEKTDSNSTLINSKKNKFEGSKKKMGICAGSIPVASEPSQVKNSAHLFTEETNEHLSLLDQSHQTNIISNKNSIVHNEPVSVSQATDAQMLKPNSCSLIYFDLETSGLAIKKSQLLEIGSVCGKIQFDVYITPTMDIDPSASEINKLTREGDRLFYKETEVDTLHLKDALNYFIVWIKDIPKPRIFLCHNAKSFDCPRFFNALDQCNLTTEFCEEVITFIDTRHLIKDVKPGMLNYKQHYLVSSLLDESYDAHNALADVEALQRLVKSLNISDSDFLRHSFTSQSRVMLYLYKMMIHRKGITQHMANKFTNNGIGLGDLKHAFETDGRAGLEVMLGEKVNAIVKCTANKNVITKIVNYLEGNMCLSCTSQWAIQ